MQTLNDIKLELIVDTWDEWDWIWDMPERRLMCDLCGSYLQSDNDPDMHSEGCVLHNEYLSSIYANLRRAVKGAVDMSEMDVREFRRELRNIAP